MVEGEKCPKARRALRSYEGREIAGGQELWSLIKQRPSADLDAFLWSFYTLPYFNKRPFYSQISDLIHACISTLSVTGPEWYV